MKICPECNQEVEVNTYTYNTYTCDMCGQSYHDKCCPSASVEVTTGYVTICQHCLEKHKNVAVKIKKVDRAYSKMEQAQFAYHDAQRELENIVTKYKIAQ